MHMQKLIKGFKSRSNKVSQEEAWGGLCIDERWYARNLPKAASARTETEVDVNRYNSNVIIPKMQAGMQESNKLSMFLWFR